MGVTTGQNIGLCELINLSTLDDKFFEFPAMCINKTLNLPISKCLEIILNDIEKNIYVS